MVAAVGSFLDARSRGGTWLVRIDDLDPARAVPGAAGAILRCLDAFGMHWDGEVVYQSTSSDAYHAALHQLRQSGRTYPCACSRKEISDAGLAGVEGAVYPGTCRNGLAAGREARALRVRTGGAVVEFHDGLQGHVRQALQEEIGDFVVTVPIMCSPTTLPAPLMMPNRASPTSCAELISFPRHRGRSICRSCCGCRRRPTCTCRWR